MNKRDALDTTPAVARNQTLIYPHFFPSQHAERMHRTLKTTYLVGITVIVNRLVGSTWVGYLFYYGTMLLCYHVTTLARNIFTIWSLMPMLNVQFTPSQ